MKNRDELELFIINLIKKFTGENSIDKTISFMDYGMVSMTVAALAGEITDKLDLPIDPVILYECPNIQSVCDHLWDEYSNETHAV